MFLFFSGEQGEVEKSQSIMAQIDLLKQVAQDLKGKILAKRTSMGNARLYSNFKVCLTCGGLQDQGEVKTKQKKQAVPNQKYLKQNFRGRGNF